MKKGIGLIIMILFVVVTTILLITNNREKTNTIVAGGEEGIFIFDISDPTNPRQVGHLDINYGEAWDVHVSGKYAYVAAEDNGLVIIDITDPTNPKFVYEKIWLFIEKLSKLGG